MIANSAPSTATTRKKTPLKRKRNAITPAQKENAPAAETSSSGANLITNDSSSSVIANSPVNTTAVANVAAKKSKTPLKRRRLTIMTKQLQQIQEEPPKPTPLVSNKTTENVQIDVMNTPIPASLRGVPIELIQKVRMTERRLQQEEKRGVKELRRRSKLLAQLPQLVEILRSVYRFDKKTSMELETLIPKLQFSQQSSNNRAELTTLLETLVEVAPEYAKFVDVELQDLNEGHEPTSQRFMIINMRTSIAETKQRLQALQAQLQKEIEAASAL